MPLTALITRPEEDAKPLADALAARGIATVIEPLLAIRPLPEAAAGLEQDLQGVQALLFTSANGARAFAALSPRRDLGVLAVGDASAAAARSLGFAAVESAAGDVQDLARLASRRLKPAGGPLFHAAGSAVAGDLAQLLSAAGFELRRRMLYESRPAEAFTAPALAALTTRKIDLVLLFSPRTAATFAELAKKDSVDTSPMSALCLSPNVALALRALTWKSIETAANPDLPAMLALVDAAKQARAEGDKMAEMPTSKATNQPPETKQPAGAKPAASPIPPSPPSPAPVPPVPPIAPRRARAGFGSLLLAAIIGAILAGAAMYGVLKYAPSQLNLLPAASGLAGGEALADLARRNDDLKQQVADLAARLDSLPKPASPADEADLAKRVSDLEQEVSALPAKSGAAFALPPQIADLPGRIAVLESKLGEAGPAAPLPAEIAALPQRLAAIDQRLGALEAKPSAAANVAAPDIAGLKADIATLKDQTAALDQRLKTIEAAAGDLAGIRQSLDAAAASDAKTAAARAGIALALGDLRLAIESGAPYAGQLASLKTLAGADGKLGPALTPAITGLEPTAVSGAPTLAQLQASFADALPKILDAAGAGEPPPGASFTDRVLAHLEFLVSIRPVGEETTGDSPPAHAARAEAKLQAGDVAGAVAELSTLTGKPADAASAWLAAARAHLAARKALADLQATAVSTLASAASGQ